MMRSRSGGAATEAALALPVVLILLGGIFEWGFLFAREIDVLHAAREGARVGASTDQEDDPVGAAETRALAALQEMNVDPATATATAAISGGEDEQVITVDVTVPYSAVFTLFPVPTTLHGELTMRLADQELDEEEG